MDAFDLVDVDEKPRRRNGDLIWNILTILVLLATACIGIVFVSILLNPYTGLNPFPPATLPPTITMPPSVTPSITAAIHLPPTWTPSPLPPPSETPTPRPTATEFILETPTPTVNEPTPLPEDFEFSFDVQQDFPQALPNIFHPELGESWMGVGGQAFGLDSRPIKSLLVQIGGTLEGKIYETKLTITGTALAYGPAGYEIQIADRLIESNQKLYVQLFDPQAGIPLSDKIFFNTYNDPQKSLILINFQQVK